MKKNTDIFRMGVGDTPPLLEAGLRSVEKRDVSFRWVFSTVLVGVMSITLMHTALIAATSTAYPVRRSVRDTVSRLAKAPQGSSSRGGRVFASAQQALRRSRRTIQLATVEKSAGADVVNKQSYLLSTLFLSARYDVGDYPDFARFEEDMATSGMPNHAAAAALLYDADMSDDVSVKITDFPAHAAERFADPPQEDDEVEEIVRQNGSLLYRQTERDEPIVRYVSPERFSDDDDDIRQNAEYAKILYENSSVFAAHDQSTQDGGYFEDVIPVRVRQNLRDLLSSYRYDCERYRDACAMLESYIGGPALEPGDILQLGLMKGDEGPDLIRITLHRRGREEVTVARKDDGAFVKAVNPLPLTGDAFSEVDGLSPAGDQEDDLTVYDGVFRSGLANGLPQAVITRILTALAKSVDLQASLAPTDRITVLLESDPHASGSDAIVYLGARIRDRNLKLYLFAGSHGQETEFFDEAGVSARQFLLRSPVAVGRISSPYGMRRHPILGTTFMHTGVDWAAPSGTPIRATGDGTVIKAGATTGGYGNQTIIRHANGFTSSYNHQKAIARHIRPGTVVHQGDVIGWVGSTGRSTGPHIHYEVSINGNRVDPMKVRFPEAQVLAGDERSLFLKQKEIIDRIVSQNETVISGS